MDLLMRQENSGNLMRKSDYQKQINIYEIEINNLVEKVKQFLGEEDENIKNLKQQGDLLRFGRYYKDGFPLFLKQKYLDEGECLGDLNIMFDQQSHFSVFLEEDCEFILLKKNQLKDLFSEWLQEKYFAMSVLSEIMSGVESSFIFQVYTRFQLRNFNYKEYIFKEGQLLGGVYLVKKGQIQLSQKFQKQTNFLHKNNICLLGENQFFGHEDYFVGNNKINKVRTIDAQAISSAEIYFMDHKYFMKLRHSELGIFLKKKHKMMIQVRKEQISKQIELEEIWNNQKMREKASFQMNKNNSNNQRNKPVFHEFIKKWIKSKQLEFQNKVGGEDLIQDEQNEISEKQREHLTQEAEVSKPNEQSFIQKKKQKQNKSFMGVGDESLDEIKEEDLHELFQKQKNRIDQYLAKKIKMRNQRLKESQMNENENQNDEFNNLGIYNSKNKSKENQKSDQKIDKNNTYFVKQHILESKNPKGHVRYQSVQSLVQMVKENQQKLQKVGEIFEIDLKGLKGYDQYDKRVRINQIVQNQKYRDYLKEMKQDQKSRGASNLNSYHLDISFLDQNLNKNQQDQNLPMVIESRSLQRNQSDSQLNNNNQNKNSITINDQSLLRLINQSFNQNKNQQSSEKNLNNSFNKISLGIKNFNSRKQNETPQKEIVNYHTQSNEISLKSSALPSIHDSRFPSPQRSRIGPCKTPLRTKQSLPILRQNQLIESILNKRKVIPTGIKPYQNTQNKIKYIFKTKESKDENSFDEINQIDFSKYKCIAQEQEMGSNISNSSQNHQ